MKNTTETSALSLLANDAGYDPLEDRLRENIRSTIEAVFEEELAQFLGCCRYGRGDALRQGYRNGHRERQLTGTFGTERVSVPRARIVEEDGRASEWRSRALPRYQRLTRKAEALIASVYLSGTNTRRVKRALFGLFRGAVSKDVVSRAWRKVKVDWDAWCMVPVDQLVPVGDIPLLRRRLERQRLQLGQGAIDHGPGVGTSGVGDQRAGPGDRVPPRRQGQDPAFLQPLQHAQAGRNPVTALRGGPVQVLADRLGEFPEAVRRIVYTTNAIESLNAKIRRAVRTRGHFPSDEAASKLLYLVLDHAAEAWKRPPREWLEAKTQFAVIFGERFVNV